MNEPADTRTSSAGAHWPLLLILFAAALLRRWQINESLWLDELHSAWVVSSGLSDVAERAWIGNQSPLYFYLPWITNWVFGTSEWSLRLPSLLAGLGLVALVYGVAWQITQSRTAACAGAVLAALDGNLLFYATEARPYAIVQVVALIQFYIFLQLLDTATTRRRIEFVLAGVLLFYLHYTAILLLAGPAVYIIFTASVYPGRQCMNAEAYSGRKFIVDLICIAAATLPTAAHLVDIGSRRQAWATFVVNTSPQLPFAWFSLAGYVAVPLSVGLLVVVVRGMSRQFSKSNRSSTRQAASIKTSAAKRPDTPRRDIATAFLLASWLGVPLFIAWLLTVFDVARLFLPRYVIGAAVAPILFAGLCIGGWKSVRWQAVTAIITIGGAIYSGGMIEQFRYDGRLFGDRTENWRDAVAQLNHDRSGNEPVFVRSGLLEADQCTDDADALLRAYCISPVTSIYKIDHAANSIRPLTTTNAGTLTAEDIRQIEATGAAWFVVNGSIATRRRCGSQVLASLAAPKEGENQPAMRHARIVNERQFGSVGTFRVLSGAVDGNVDSAPR